MPVNTEHPKYTENKEKWSRFRDCFSGPDAIRGGREKYLPRLPTMDESKEGQEAYDSYLDRAMYFNGTRPTVAGLAGAIFQRDPTVTAPDEVKEQAKKITRKGESLEIAALTMLREVLLMGRFGVLVDFPREDQIVGAVPARAYWALYNAEDIVGWRVDYVEGRERLTRVVLRESEMVPDEKDATGFSTKTQDVYRVCELEDGKYRQSEWVQDEREGHKKEWIQRRTVDVKRRGDPLTFIPFTFIGPTSRSSEVDDSPCEDLVEVNLSHFLTSADLEWGRHLVALPQPWVSGLMNKEPDAKGLAWGPSHVMELAEGGSAGMVEFAGSGMGHLATAEETKRRQMATLGARLLEDTPTTQETLGAVQLRQGGQRANVRTIAATVDEASTVCLQWFVWWNGTAAKPEDVDVRVELSKDLATSKMTPQELTAWVGALQEKSISYDTFYAGLVDGELARPGITAEEELAAIEAFATRRAKLAEKLMPKQPAAGPPAAPPPEPGAP